jgi:hypothetical protein
MQMEDKSKQQIELAQTLIANLQDYVELAKVQKKLKTQSVAKQLESVTEFVQNNVEEL